MAFFADGVQLVDMTGLREAMRSLPDAAFADLMDGGEAYLAVVDLPGGTADSVDVRVETRCLRVEARREKDVPAGFTYREEERPLFLDLELPLPPDATDEGATATIERGVLEVRLPKTRVGGRDIPVEE